MTNLTPRVPEVGVLAKDETHGEDFRDELEGEDIQVQPLTYLYKRSLECLCGSVRERVREGGGVGVGRETGIGVRGGRGEHVSITRRGGCGTGNGVRGGRGEHVSVTRRVEWRRPGHREAIGHDGEQYDGIEPPGFRNLDRQLAWQVGR